MEPAAVQAVKYIPLFIIRTDFRGQAKNLIDLYPVFSIQSSHW